MRALVAIAALLLAACGGTAPAPEPEGVVDFEMWSLKDGGMDCPGATSQGHEGDRCYCEWSCVRVNGHVVGLLVGWKYPPTSTDPLYALTSAAKCPP